MPVLPLCLHGVSKRRVSLQNVISGAWHAKRDNERSVNAGDVYFVGTVVDISFPLAKISGIINDHR
jgi:hypothetical protein